MWKHASEQNFAHIKLKADGYCPFLDSDGLCQPHARFGITALSNACAFFPQVLSAYRDDVEMTGALSCPEVVRFCLLGDMPIRNSRSSSRPYYREPRRVYQENWDRLNAQYGVRLEQCLGRYLVNCLQREWFISMPNPFVYMHLLTIRLAILRFLIAGHPQIQRCLQQQAGGAEIDKYIVETVYLFARGIDQNLPFLQVVYEAMAEQQMMSFDYAMPLIKF